MEDKDVIRNEFEEIFERSFTRVLQVLVGLVIGILLCLMLSSCRTVYRMVEVETVRVDTTYIAKVQWDSLVKHDSIYLHEYVRGDTVFVEKTRWYRVVQDRFRTDTLYRLSVDTLRKEVYIEKKPTLLEKSGYRIQGAALVALMGVVAWLLLRLFKNRP